MTRRTLTENLEAAFAFAIPVTWYGGLLAMISLNIGPSFAAVEVPPAPERIVMLEQTFDLDALKLTEHGPELEVDEEILADSAPAEAAEPSEVGEPAELTDAAAEVVPAQASAPALETTPEAELAAAAMSTAAAGIPGVRVRTSLGATAMSRPERPKSKNKPNCETDDGIVQVNGSEYSVPRELLDHYTSNLSDAARLAYVSWHTDGGEVDGFKVRRMNCANVLRQAGLMNGDVIHKINGRKVTTIAQALKAYARLRNNRTLKLEVTRKDGTRLNLKYKLS